MRLREVLDRLIAKQEEQNATLIRLTETVEYHVKRTDLLEKQVNKIENNVEEVEKHVLMVNGFLKGFGVLSAIVGTITAIGVGIYKLALFLKGIL